MGITWERTNKLELKNKIASEMALVDCSKHFLPYHAQASYQTDNIIEQANVRDHFYQYPLSDSLSYLMKRNPKHHPASQFATPLLVLNESLHFHSIQWV